MQKITRKTKVEYVHLNKMKVSDTVQRQLRPPRVNELLSAFDIEQLGLPVLSQRDDGFHIVDGQHRIEALKGFLGHDDVAIQCQIVTGLNDEQEADMFLKVNNMLPVNSYDEFMVSLQAKYDAQVNVARVVNQQGLYIARATGDSFHVGSRLRISCVTTLMSCYEKYGEAVLGRSLRILRDAYGAQGLEAVMVDGISRLCHRYSGVIDEQKVKERLSEARGGLKSLLQRAEDIKLRTGRAKAVCVAAAAVDIINAGRGNHHLESWWKTEEAA